MSQKTKTAETSDETVDEQIEALHAVVTPVPPTVGRIVHFRIDLAANPDDEPTLRPALVIEANEDGSAYLQVFHKPEDARFPGSGILPPSAVVTEPWFAPRAVEGDDCGEWRWPQFVHPVGEVAVEEPESE